MVELAFRDERLGLEVSDDRLVGHWQGPPGLTRAAVATLVEGALEAPADFPPLRTAVVPGDRVVIALGVDVPEPALVINALYGVVRAAGVEAVDLTVLAPPGAAEPTYLPDGVVFARHDPDDRDSVAYLASTKNDRRIYLNRMVTDADLVIPVGRLGYDATLGYSGPWSAVYPGLSNAETIRAFRSLGTDPAPSRAPMNQPLGESTEVGWLLGSQFQLGLVRGASGAAGVVGGSASAVLERGKALVDDLWTFHAGSRAELVVVGVGRADEPTSLDDLARGLATATRLVQRGGRVVVLSRAEGAIGPALQRLAEADDARVGPSALRGLEAEPDYPAALVLARALVWADVYLLSGLDGGLVESLGMVHLDRPEAAARLAAADHSCLVVSHADETFAAVSDD